MDSEHPDYLQDIPDEDHHKPDDPGPQDNRNMDEQGNKQKTNGKSSKDRKVS